MSLTSSRHRQGGSWFSGARGLRRDRPKTTQAHSHPAALEPLEQRLLLSVAPAFEWVDQFGTEGPAIDIASAADADGNVYVAGDNAVRVFDFAAASTQRLRAQNDTLTDFQREIEDREADFKSRLIEIFGTPYEGDIGGSGGTFEFRDNYTTVTIINKSPLDMVINDIDVLNDDEQPLVELLANNVTLDFFIERDAQPALPLDLAP